MAAEHLRAGLVGREVPAGRRGVLEEQGALAGQRGVPELLVAVGEPVGRRRASSVGDLGTDCLPLPSTDACEC